MSTAYKAAQVTHAKFAKRYEEVCEQTKRAVAAYQANNTERNKRLSTAAVKLADVAKKELDKLALDVETKRLAVEATPEQKKPVLGFDHSVKNSTIAKASAMWEVVKEQRKLAIVTRMIDKQKLTYFREKMQYKMLMDELPIVTRYMICMGQYSARALARVIDKSAALVHPPPEKRPRDYTQEQWICRQADYVQYMWEDYNKKKHTNMAERKYVWDSTYKLLKGEFDDFKTLHEDMSQHVEEEKKQLTGSLARDLLQRVKERSQKMNDADELVLANQLLTLLYKKAFDSVLIELRNEYPPLVEACVGYGTAQEQPNKQTVRMVETVEADRMTEIPDHYKPEELRGMEPVYEAAEDEYELITHDLP